MAVIAATDMGGSGSRAVTITILGASDTFVFNSAKNPVLILNNVTAGALTPKIDGDGGSATFPCPGVGDIDVTGGLVLASIGAGDSVAIPLNSINAYLVGVITIDGADAIEAQILEF